jgi:hypothetical protein
VGEPKFETWSQLAPKQRLRALLGDQWWGPHAGTGDEWIQTHFLHLEQQRTELLAAGAGSHQAAGAPCRTRSASGAGARAHGSGYG